ncbi:MAG: YbaN family protein [Acidimicrobiia bacterium]|nr:YbaN family protein [Acidimicrobiia bacterium]
METPNRSPVWLRPVLVAAGLGAVAIGVAGIFLPLVPTLGPLLFAAWCFARSSERLYRWLLGHPRLGRIIAPFRSGAVMPLRVKAVVLAVMAVSFGVSGAFLLQGLVPRLVLAGAAVVASAAVLLIPTGPRRAAEPGA